LALRIVPSGVMHRNVELFVGGGTVVNLQTLINELDGLSELGIDVSRVKISDRAHVVFPYHVERDRAGDAARTTAIGTTGRGIGPAYVDRVARTGTRFADLLRADDFEGITPKQVQRVRPHIVDGFEYLQERLEQGKRVLLEGAQGALLDVGYGTYPYVTSSHTIAGGACTGLGIGPGAIGRVIGVLKAYATRVGAGPFPSELHDERGERLRRQGGEYGTVTGRPRRCGWLDAVGARYAAKLDGITSAVITKLDVLTGFERIGIVTGYRLHGQPAGFAEIGEPELEAQVEEMPGWGEPLRTYRKIDDLPKAAREYIDRVRTIVGVPIELVSVGRERTQLAR
jgi:adenylosuccinate synthase